MKYLITLILPFIFISCMTVKVEGFDTSGNGGKDPTGSETPKTTTDSGSSTPAEISLKNDIIPSFGSGEYNCTNCHNKNSSAGALDLEGTVFTDLTSEKAVNPAQGSEGRINKTNPALSLILTDGLNEGQAGRTAHPTPPQTGAWRGWNTDDPVYKNIVNWITQGAKDN